MKHKAPCSSRGCSGLRESGPRKRDEGDDDDGDVDEDDHRGDDSPPMTLRRHRERGGEVLPLVLGLHGDDVPSGILLHALR